MILLLLATLPGKGERQYGADESVEHSADRSRQGSVNLTPHRQLVARSPVFTHNNCPMRDMSWRCELDGM